jgi:thioredoxin-like negative regulator of GroEL
MNRTALFVAMISCVSLHAAEIKWSTSYPEALRAARTNDKPMLVDLGAEWCGWCKLMDKETYGDSRVKNALANFICVKVDVDKDPETAIAFQASSLPRTVIISRASQIAADNIGYLDADRFLAFFTAARVRIDSGFADAQMAPGLATLVAVERVVEVAADAGTNRCDQLVTFLAATNLPVRREAAARLREAGGAAIPPLVRALANPQLGVRIAALELLETAATNHPPFDPWAVASERAARCDEWNRWLAERR